MDRPGSPFQSHPMPPLAYPSPGRADLTCVRPRAPGHVERGARCRGLRAATQRARDEHRSEARSAVGWGGLWCGLGGLKGAAGSATAAVASTGPSGAREARSKAPESSQRGLSASQLLQQRSSFLASQRGLSAPQLLQHRTLSELRLTIDQQKRQGGSLPDSCQRRQQNRARDPHQTKHQHRHTQGVSTPIIAGKTLFS